MVWSIRSCSVLIAALIATLFGAPPAELAAQNTGSIRGRVVAATTLQPLAGAQIVVEGTGRGSLTNSSGEFLIVGVPAGSHTVRAQMIGYTDGTASVTVAAGGTATANFALDETAIALDEVVVTGQPGATQRRAIGTSVASLDVEEELEVAPIANVSELLQGRGAGITSFGASGTAGGAGTIVLRGMTSMTQDNSPLIYVDGIRIDTDQNSLIYLGGQTTSRLNDLNPNDIARVEIIKGAAATALYGTEASNGVIQIFTKKGRPGESVYNASVKIGGTRIPSVFPLMHPDPQYPSANDLLSTGLYQEYSASMRGGAEKISHFVSGTYLSNEGSFVANYFERANGRVNLSVLPADNITVDFTSNFSWSKAQLPFNDNYIYGILTTLLLGNPVTKATPTDPYGGAFIPVPYAISIVNTDEAYRFTGGVTLRHRPSDVFNHKLTIGLESVDGTGTSTWPYAPNPYNPQGQRDVARRNNLQANFDYSATLTSQLTSSIGSQLSVGGQIFTTRDHRVSASGEKFAAPGLSVVDATAIQSVGESLLEYSTGGAFLQEQLSFRDVLFLIGGVRVDGSSAFGDDFGWQVLPKASVSYVISDEEWFALPGISTMRLRGGFGMSGTQPGAFDAVRTYSPFTAFDGQVAIHTDNLGNPNLAPEISTEWEAGVDLGFWGDRASLTTTFYHQTTTDALLEKQFAPSLGFLSEQLTNLGKLRNIGLELSGQAILMQRPDFNWSVNASYAYNDNEVLDMGDIPYIQIDRFGTRIVEGYPLSGKWEFVTVGTDENGYPIKSDTVHYLGTSMPPHTGGFGTDVTWGDLQLFANAQFALGHVVNNHNRPYMIRLKTGEEYFRAVMANNDDPVRPQTDAVKQLIARANIYGDFIEDADWLKLREVGLAYNLPDGFSGMFGADNTRLSVSARNLLTLTGYSGTDPEISSTFEEGSLSIGADYFTVPQARQLIVGLDVTF